MLPAVPQTGGLCMLCWLADRQLPVLLVQQPVEQELESQTQAPEALHSWPLTQVWHAAPPTPQVVALFVWHAPFLQQPFGQDVPSQTQAPALQCWPEGQVKHMLPDVPQTGGLCMVCAVADRQVPPLQQPLGQEVASQTQAPPALHSWPLAQPLHAAPPTPQVVALLVWQAPFLSQQPLGQEVASQMQAPPLQRWPVPHCPHTLPEVPHAEFVCVVGVTQVPPVQQPVGHEVASQTQAPAPLHSWPLAQDLHAAPPTPQAELLDAWQTPLLSQQPFGQEVASQTQLPCALHSWLVAQAEQAPPFAPQWALLAVTHCPLEQQPPQLVPPQLQAPELQLWPLAQVPQARPFEPHADVLWFASSTH
jgi:hypothetical protein